jgi:hypothetical protein
VTPGHESNNPLLTHIKVVADNAHALVELARVRVDSVVAEDELAPALLVCTGTVVRFGGSLKTSKAQREVAIDTELADIGG